MSTDGILEYQGTKRVLFRGDTSNIVFDTRTTSLGIGVTGSNDPSSNLYITGNAYVSSNLAIGGVMTMGVVNVAARHNLQAVTAMGNITPLTVEFTNPTTSIVASGNVEVGGNVVAGYLYGDGSNISGISSTLQAITDSGPGANVTSNTVQFTNSTTSIIASGNVEIGAKLDVNGVAKFQNIYYFARASVSSNFQNSGSATYINVHQRSNGGLISTDSGTKIQLNTSDANGVYMVWCSVSVKTDSGQERGFGVSLVKGNTVFASTRCNINHITSSTYTQLVCSGLINLTSGDKVYHQTASGYHVHAPDTNFYMYRISS